jgi:hypothetical protein
MSALRAIIMLLVYGAFTMGAVFASHSCNELCGSASIAHPTHGETGVPPSECSEKEAVNNQMLEHRSGSAVKFILHGVAASNITSRYDTKKIHEASFVVNTSNEPQYRLPIYISNCVYRL